MANNFGEQPPLGADPHIWEEYGVDIPRQWHEEDQYLTQCQQLGQQLGERPVRLHGLLQSILADIDYNGTARSDELWWQLHALQEANGLGDGVTADDLYNLYRTNYGGDRDGA